MHRLNAKRGEREKGKSDGTDRGRLKENGGGLRREERMERRLKEGKDDRQ